jgi:twinkle protein
VESLLVNLTMRSQWRHAIFSPEHYPLAMHFMRLAEKLLGKTASNYNGFDKIGVDDLNKAKVDLGAHFFWIEPKEGEATLDGILGRATALVFRQGIRTLVIDPWNELEHERPANLSETEYVSKCLSKIKRWARTHDVHVFLIAHPTKMARGRDGKYPIPTPYDISGSANFRNKADNCITIWRELDGNKSLLVQIHVQKVKWKVEGRIGVAELEYVPATGRYKDGRVV